MAFYLVNPELAESRGGGKTRAQKILAGRWPGAPRAAAVLKIDGTYITVDAPSTDQIAAATEVFYGGHVNELTAAQKVALEAAGYTTVTV
jgi:hypothetical protein